ncbi:MAG: GAF domain-containing protein [Acidimicrobiia bacterium]
MTAPADRPTGEGDASATSILFAATIGVVSFPLASPATAPTPAVEQAVSDGIVAAGGSPTIPLAILAMATVATVIALGLRMRRRTRRRAEGGLDQMLEAGRRMTKALDRDEIAHIALSEAVILADATHGAFVAIGHGVMELLVASDDIFDGRRLGEGLLQRIADTGQPINVVSHDEPALTALPVAILGVPVIGSGRVTGIITLVRPDHRPFGAREDAIVSRLAPMVGSALAAAERHDGITALSFVDPLTALPNRRSIDRRRGGRFGLSRAGGGGDDRRRPLQELQRHQRPCRRR